MSQDLSQILFLIGAVLGAGFALPFLMAWLEPRPAQVPRVALRTQVKLIKLAVARQLARLDVPAEQRTNPQTGQPTT